MENKFREWLKIKEAEMVVGNRCIKNGKDYQVAGDPCASAKLNKKKKV